DALHDRADAGEVEEQAGGDSEGRGDEQFLHRDFRGGLAQPASGDETEDHGAQRRDEAEREIAAAVKNERPYTREEVQEPLVERVAQIGVLVPVRHETGVIVSPVGRDAYGLVIEAGAGYGI